MGSSQGSHFEIFDILLRAAKSALHNLQEDKSMRRDEMAAKVARVTQMHPVRLWVGDLSQIKSTNKSTKFAFPKNNSILLVLA